MKSTEKAAPQGQPAFAIPSAQPGGLKIAIVGTASTSVNEAPWEDKSWQIWSLGRNSVACPRYDLWFELHTKDVLLAANALAGREEFLKTAGNKLMVGHPWPELPEAKLYPWADVISIFGRYLTSSLAEMLAYAILQNPVEIGLWGVDMVCPDEYAHQRASCEYFLGIAFARGIKITIAKESPILRPTRVYGLEDAGFSREIIERKAELVAQLREEEQKLNVTRENVTLMRGQIAVLNELETRWG